MFNFNYFSLNMIYVSSRSVPVRKVCCVFVKPRFHCGFQPRGLYSSPGNAEHGMQRKCEVLLRQIKRNYKGNPLGFEANTKGILMKTIRGASEFEFEANTKEILKTIWNLIQNSGFITKHKGNPKENPFGHSKHTMSSFMRYHPSYTLLTQSQPFSKRYIE